jgi:phosphate uptake regulator
MAASARLMVLMSPEERASLNTKARTLGVSAGEFVRRAVQAYELGTEEEAAELRELVDVFNQIHPETLQIADESHRKVAEALAGLSSGDPVGRRRRKTAAA